MKFKEYLNEDRKDWHYHVDDNYLTLDLSQSQLFDIFHKFIYNLPKKYSNRKEIMSYLRKEGYKFKASELKGYLDSFDESRLENLIHHMEKAIRSWGGLS